VFKCFWILYVIIKFEKITNSEYVLKLNW
jgi:hypothetical protein